MHLSITNITILAHVFLLLFLSFLIQAKELSPSPWVANKVDDDHSADNRFPKHSCTGKQLFCRKDEDGLEVEVGNKKIIKCCKHRCVDTDTDVKNCGYCGKVCPFPRQCCKGFCVDTNNSRFNCGKCGNKCRFRVRCVYGMCGYGQADPPRPRKGRRKQPHPPEDRHPSPPVDHRSSSFV